MNVRFQKLHMQSLCTENNSSMKVYTRGVPNLYFSTPIEDIIGLGTQVGTKYWQVVPSSTEHQPPFFCHQVHSKCIDSLEQKNTNINQSSHAILVTLPSYSLFFSLFKHMTIINFYTTIIKNRPNCPPQRGNSPLWYPQSSQKQ